MSIWIKWKHAIQSDANSSRQPRFCVSCFRRILKPARRWKPGWRTTLLSWSQTGVSHHLLRRVVRGNEPSAYMASVNSIKSIVFMHDGGMYMCQRFRSCDNWNATLAKIFSCENDESECTGLSIDYQSLTISLTERSFILKSSYYRRCFN